MLHSSFSFRFENSIQWQLLIFDHNPLGKREKYFASLLIGYLNIRGARVIAYSSTNDIGFVFVSHLKIVYCNNY